MKRFAILSTALCVMLSGCTTEQPLNDDTTPNIESGTPPESETDANQTQAFVFDSGVLEIGDFDPYTIGDDIFDPCTEITQEEFAAAGFEDVEPVLEKYAGIAQGKSACFVRPDEDTFTLGFINNNSNRELIEAATDLFEFKSNLIPELFTFGPIETLSVGCFAQVDTERGALVAAAAGLEGFTTREDTCSKAISAIEGLYRLNQ